MDDELKAWTAKLPKVSVEDHLFPLASRRRVCRPGALRYSTGQDSYWMKIIFTPRKSYGGLSVRASVSIRPKKVWQKSDGLHHRNKMISSIPGNHFISNLDGIFAGAGWDKANAGLRDIQKRKERGEKSTRCTFSLSQPRNQTAA